MGLKTTPSELLQFMQQLNHGKKQTAELLGVTPQAVQLWLDGKRDIPMIATKVIQFLQRNPHMIQEWMK